MDNQLLICLLYHTQMMLSDYRIYLQLDISIVILRWLLITLLLDDHQHRTIYILFYANGAQIVTGDIQLLVVKENVSNVSATATTRTIQLHQPPRQLQLHRLQQLLPQRVEHQQVVPHLSGSYSY